ncbi:MAG: valine--tRNA ligase, partial [Deltaproteobacteria bacterium]
ADVTETGKVSKESLGIEDRWIITRLSKVVKEVSEAIENYRFNEAAGACYQFVWHEFCDWYVEMSKWYLYGNEKQKKKNTLTTLLNVLSAVLRLLHPFMPFVTEEIWQKLPGKRESIMVSKFPEAEDFFEDEQALKEIGLVMDVITAIRNVRGELRIPPSKRVNVVIDAPGQKAGILNEHVHHIKALAKVEDIQIGQGIEKPDSSATSVVEDISIYVLLKGLLNIEEEKKRIMKEIKKVQKDIEMFEKKLQNKNFVEKAPSHVVEEVREKLSMANEKFSKLEQSLKFLESIS